MPRMKRQEVLALVIVSVGCLALYAYRYRLLVHGGILSHGDFREQFVPWRCFYSLALERGEVGLWNPFLCRGYPHLAEGQAGILHPAHLLLYRFLPVTAAVLLELLLILPCMFAGMLLFLRRSWSCDWLPALFGAGIVTFGIFFPRQYTHINMLWIYAHLPWALLFLERCFRGTCRRRWLIALTLGFASMILLGHPPTVWHNALACLVLVVFVGWQQQWSGTFRRRLVPVLAAGLIALLIGMVQILPTYDYAKRSPRQNLTRAQVAACSLEPLNLLPNLAPGVYPQGFVPGPHPDEGGADWSLENPAYFGFWTLCFVVCGLILWRERIFRGSRIGAAAILGAAGLLLLLLALGGHVGLIYVFRVLPVVRNFRAPVRYIAVLIVLLAAVAAYVLQTILRHPDRGPLTRRDGIYLGLAAVPALAVTVWAAIASSLTVLGESVPLGSGIVLLQGPLILAIVLAVFRAYLRRPQSRILLAILIVAALQDTSLYLEPFLRNFIRQGRVYRVADIAPVREKMATVPHAFRVVAADNEPVLAGHYIANGYLGIPPPDVLRVFGPQGVREHLYLASIRYAFLVENGQPTIREFRSAFPRVRLVPNLQAVAEPVGKDLVGRADFYDFIRTTALCRPGVTRELQGPPLAAGETVKIRDDGYARLVIDVNVTHERLLVVSDRWWPHWQATVDGQPRGIIPLYDGMLRGMFVKPGEREVIMTYKSMPLQQGMALSAVGLLLLAALAAYEIYTTINYHRRHRAS